MNFTIELSDSIFNQLPEMEVHGVFASDVDVSRLATLDILVELSKHTRDPEIDKTIFEAWRQFHREHGSAKKARASVEYVLKAAKNERLRKISPLVDLYNLASFLSGCPFGGEDVEKITGGLILDTAQGNEDFLPLMSDALEHPLPGEIIWKDKTNAVICRSVNWIESDISKITEMTRNVVFITEQPDKNFPSGANACNILIEIFAKYGTAANLQMFTASSAELKIEFEFTGR